jgi:aminotransferase EvaB
VIPLNDTRRQYVELRSEIDAAVARVLDSGWYVHGREHAAFETDFAAAAGSRHCIAVGNGTDALELALLAVGCGPGTEVVTVANAGFYAAAAALKLGAHPRFVDVEPQRLLVDPALVSAAITPQTRAVVVTHLYGQLAQVEAVVEAADALDVPVVEDCAQAVGAVRGGRRAGNYGAIGTFSFYPTKNLGAMGDGGALVTDDEELAQRLRQLRQYGWTDKYRVSVAGGRNSRLDELQAAVLRVKLPHVDRWNARRGAIIVRYREALRGCARLRLVSTGGGDDVGHLCVVLAEDRDEVARQLARAGVPTAVHYPLADHEQPALAGVGALAGPLPVTDAAQHHILTLPCYAEMTDAEIDQVCDALREL